MLSCLVRLEEDFLHSSKFMMVHSLNFCPRIIWLISFAWLWNCFYASLVIVEKTTDTFFTCLHRMVKRLDSIFTRPISHGSKSEFLTSTMFWCHLSQTRVGCQRLEFLVLQTLQRLPIDFFWKFWVVLSLVRKFRSSLFMHQQQPKCFLTLWLGPIPYGIVSIGLLPAT